MKFGSGLCCGHIANATTIDPDSDGQRAVESDMPIETRREHKAIARIIALFLVGTIGLIAMLYIFLQAAGLESGVGIPKGLTDVLKWLAVASFGLASVCFSFYRTFDKEEEIQLRVRGVGSRLLLSSLLMLVILSIAVATEIFARFPGANTNPPLEQIAFPLVMIFISIYFLILVYTAIEKLAEVLIAVIHSDREISSPAPSRWDWIKERTDGKTVGRKSPIDTPASKPDKTQGN